MKTTIYLDHQPAEGGTEHVVHVLLRLEGEAPPGDRRAPLNLSLVLDRSGSMAGEKLEAAKEAAVQLVRRLAPEDVVSVVAYDDEVRTVAEPGTGGEQAGLTHAIQAIRPGGSTNLSGGWLKGRELVARNRRDGAVNRVLLMTDGLANAGIVDHDQLVGLAATAGREGVGTTTIGFGDGYNERLLRGMADAGLGGTYYIEHADQATEVFGAEIDGLLALSAQNVEVEVRPAAGATLALIHHAYAGADVEGGRRLSLGDLYAREPKSLLAQFLVPASEGDEAVDVATLVVTADVVSAAGVERRELRLPITASLAGGAVVSPEVRREMLLLAAADARTKALEHRDRGEFDEARKCLEATSRRLRAEMPAGDERLAEEVDDLAAMAERFEEDGVMLSEADAKYLYQRAYSSSTSRMRSSDVISRSKRRGGS